MSTILLQIVQGLTPSLYRNVQLGAGAQARAHVVLNFGAGHPYSSQDHNGNIARPFLLVMLLLVGVLLIVSDVSRSIAPNTLTTLPKGLQTDFQGHLSAIPMSFLENQGQFPPNIAMLSHGNEYTVAFHEAGFELLLSGQEHESSDVDNVGPIPIRVFLHNAPKKHIPVHFNRVSNN